MEKIIDVIKKNENIFIVLLIAVSIIGVVYGVSFTVSDELWNFQNVYKMYNGFEIYKDANVICTPLFFWLGNIIFNILGANYFVFRIYNILIFIFYYFMSYKILRELGVSIKYSTISILLFIMFGTYLLPRVMANYNSLAVAFCLLGVYLLIKNKCKINAKNIVIQSIVCFLIILTKQNIGVFYLIALTIVIFIKKENNKFFGILQEAGILTILCGIFLIILKINGLLDGFINYAVLGINQFASENISFYIQYIIAAISIVMVNLCTSIFLVRQKKIQISNEEKNNLFILNCFSIGNVLLIYPIANLTHFLFAINISIILLIYIFYIIFKRSNVKIKKIDFIIKIFLVVLILIDIGINIYRFVKWSKEILSDEYAYTYENPFFGAIIEDEMAQDIETITSYIEQNEKEGKDVIVFSSKAALYMIPLKESNGFYDLPFNGNFGNLNTQDIINDLKQKNNVVILIDEDTEKLTWQENKEVINDIKEEFQYKENIGEFDVYIPYI